MVDPHAQHISAPTRWDFHAYFARKYWRLIGSALNKNEKTQKFDTDQQVIALRELYNAQLGGLHQNPQPAPAFPRIIWMLWQQGWDDAPEVVRRCSQSWRDMNPGWDLRLIGEADLAKLAPDYASVTVPEKIRTATSNIARLSLLKTHGGVWADATLFCQQPLDDWLPHVMGSGVFMFHEPRPYRYSDIWFMASEPNSILMAKWLDIARQYWVHTKIPHHYYWLEYLFEYLCARDDEVAQIWSKTDKLTALPALMAGRDPFNPDVCSQILRTIDDRVFPVHKLSHKWTAPSADIQGSPFEKLTGLSTYGRASAET